MAELRECQCGSTKTRVVEQGHTWNGLRRCNYRGCCLECGLTTPVFDEREQAISAWNTRAHDAEMERMRAENQWYKDAVENGDIIVCPHCNACAHRQTHWSQEPCRDCYGQDGIGEKGYYFEAEAEAALEKEGRG